MASSRIRAVTDAAEAAFSFPQPTILAGAGVLEEIGKHIKLLGTAPALLVGNGGFPLIAERIERSLQRDRLPYLVRQHEGYCDVQVAERHALHLANKRPDVLVAVGGGRVLDTAKLVAQELNIPIVCVPTSAATCAAVTKVSVPYTEDGVCGGGLTLKRMPQLVVLDFDVLRRAPAHLLAAGIVDANAKYHEVRLASNHSQATPELDAALNVCEALHDILQEHGEEAYQACLQQRDTQALTEVLEAVIVLPGLASALAGPANRVAIAHLVHNLATHYPHRPTILHGELVGFGVMCQLLLESTDPARVHAEGSWYQRLNLPFSLAQLGFGYSDQQNLARDVAASSVAQAYFPGLSYNDVLQAFDSIEEFFYFSSAH